MSNGRPCRYSKREIKYWKQISIERIRELVEPESRGRHELMVLREKKLWMKTWDEIAHPEYELLRHRHLEAGAHLACHVFLLSRGLVFESEEIARRFVHCQDLARLIPDPDYDLPETP